MYMDGYAKKSQQVGVGMAGCKQGILYEDYTSNVIPTAFLYMTPFCGLCSQIIGKCSLRDGVTYVVYICPALPATPI